MTTRRGRTSEATEYNALNKKINANPDDLDPVKRVRARLQ